MICLLHLECKAYHFCFFLLKSGMTDREIDDTITKRMANSDCEKE